jgi:endonuclease YncB( thermonuclease family)
MAQEGRPRIKSGLTIRRQGAVTMTSIDRDRDVYGRLLRNVSVNGRDVGATLISAGVARAYAGGRRPWCG